MIKQETDKTYTVTYSKRPGRQQYPNISDYSPVSMKRILIDSKVDAKRIYDELVVLVNKKIEQRCVPTWSKMINTVIVEKKQKGENPNSVDSFEAVLCKWTSRWLSMPVTSITKQEAHKLVTHDLIAVNDGHRRYITQCMRTVFRYAVDQGHLTINPTPLLTRRQKSKISAVMTEEQTQKLLHEALSLRSDWYYHWTLAVYTGLRNGELYALAWDDISLDENKITVRHSWVPGVGMKDTKSGDDRIVPISEHLMSTLKEMYLYTGGKGFVLPRLPEWDKGEQARHLRMFMMGIGLKPMRFHDLRATWATMLLSKGVPPATVMAMGGWKDIGTMLIYTRKAGIDVKNATNCLDLTPKSKLADVIKLKL
jgi:integrase